MGRYSAGPFPLGLVLVHKGDLLEIQYNTIVVIYSLLTLSTDGIRTDGLNHYALCTDGLWIYCIRYECFKQAIYIPSFDLRNAISGRID